MHDPGRPWQPANARALDALSCPQPRTRHRLIRTFATNTSEEIPANNRLASSRQPRNTNHEINVDRPNHGADRTRVPVSDHARTINRDSGPTPPGVNAAIGSSFVGVVRFERTTTCTPYRCATRLRHTPSRQLSITNEYYGDKRRDEV